MTESKNGICRSYSDGYLVKVALMLTYYSQMAKTCPNPDDS
jgi:hypothetical protein